MFGALAASSIPSQEAKARARQKALQDVVLTRVAYREQPLMSVTSVRRKRRRRKRRRLKGLD